MEPELELKGRHPDGSHKLKVVGLPWGMQPVIGLYTPEWAAVVSEVNAAFRDLEEFAKEHPNDADGIVQRHDRACDLHDRERAIFGELPFVKEWRAKS